MKQLFVVPRERFIQETVYVRAYSRFRLGKWERVRWHFRGLPVRRLMN